MGYKSLNRHIVVISQYFHPEQFRINDICTEWVKRGYKVTVVTGIPNYPQGRYFDGYGLFKRRRDSYNGTEIIRNFLIPRGKNTVMLSLNYLSFIVSGWFWKTFTRIKADCVFIFGLSPILQALPGVWYAKKRKIPCYLYVQDLWPESVEIIAKSQSRRIIDVIGKIVDSIYADCTRIFTTSNSFIHSIHQRGVPLHKLEFWPQYAEDFYIPLKRTAISEISEDAFNLIFTGNIGNAQGLEVLPNAALIIKESKVPQKIRFIIVGDGRFKRELMDKVESMNVGEMFHFIEKQPPERIPLFIAASDAALLSLTNDPLFEITIPAKLQSYMACGIPIIASASGETSRIIQESHSGICSPPGEHMQLAKNILDVAGRSPQDLRKLGANGREYYERNFNKQVLLDRMDQFLK